jgi:7-carboxy-7-deazaguanine synthase
MPVMEVFGPTIQGEGMVVGRKTMFVRTGGCDYSCAWCDSAFTWNGEQKATMMTAQEVWDQLEEIGTVQVRTETPDGPDECFWWPTRNFNHVTISGGNPALIGAAMNDFIDICHNNGVQIGLETQGSRWQDWFYKINDLTISPKPPSSGMTTDWGKLDAIVEKLYASDLVDYSLKVVIFDDADFEFAKEVYRRYVTEKGTAYRSMFYVSVGNEDAKTEEKIAGRLLDKLDWLWSKVLADPDCNDWKPLPQLHTLVWDNKRGV